MNESRITSRLAWIVCALGLLGAALFIGYTTMFASSLPYDDEGYMMISVRGYLAGHPLFREVYTQYGPFFFLTRRMLFAVLGVPMSHDVNRLVALGEWAVAAILWGVVAGRLTRSTWMGLLAGGLAFVHLEVFVKEPGHPQELCMILLALSLALGTLHRRRAALVGMGIACAALATTKINVGAYLTLSVLLALALTADRIPFARLTRGLAAALALALPVIVMAPRLEFPAVRVYAALVAASVAGALLAARRPEQPLAPDAWDIVRFAAPIPLMAAAVLATVWLEGTTWRDLLDGLVLEPQRFAKTFNVAWIPLGREGLIAAAAGLTTAVLTRRATGLGWLKLAFGVGVVGVALSEFIMGANQALTSGGATRGHATTLLVYGTPFLWLLLVPDGEHPRSFAAYFGRLLLCLVAALQALLAFPVFGTQVGCATVVTLVAGLVATHDATVALGGAWRLVPLVPLPLLAVALGLKADFNGRRYREYPPLGLWGASRLHLEPEKVRTFSALTEDVATHADTFVSILGFNSLYFWTRLEPPTFFNATSWPWMLSQDQQQQIVAALRRHEHPIVVYDTATGYLHYRQHRDPNGVLGTFIVTNFAPARSIGQYQLMVPRTPPR